MTYEQALNEESPKGGDPPYYELRIALERARNERDRLREALEFYAYNEWADGYPGGVFVDDEHTILDFGETAMEALREDGDE